jgi:hypothetical protein
MALTNVNNAIAKLVVETRIEIVDKMKAYLKEKLEMEESDLNELVDEFKNTLDLKVKDIKVTKKGKKNEEEGEEKTKKKRVAGPYNLFLGEQIKMFKIQDPESKESKKFMSNAQEAWKTLKAKYPDMATDSAKLYDQWKKDNGKQ